MVAALGACLLVHGELAVKKYKIGVFKVVAFPLQQPFICNMAFVFSPLILSELQALHNRRFCLYL